MFAMTTVGTVVLAVYAVLMLAGGIIGFRVAGSRASLISGVASGVLLLLAFGWSLGHPRNGFLSGALVALLLTIVFAIRLAKTGHFMPSGMLLAASLAALAILAISAWQS